MATISDILKKPDGTASTSNTIVFQTVGAPWARTDAVTSGGRVSVTTHASTGAFSTTLLQGTYTVTWRLGAVWSELTIAVPASSNTYDLHQIVVVDDETEFRNVFDDWADFQTAYVPATSEIALLHETEDGARDIFFFRSDHANVAAFTPDGVNVIEDASNQRFLRQGVDPEDLA